MTDRRTFLKKVGIAAATAVAAPIAANAMGMAPKNGKDLRLKADENINSRLIVPHGNALPSPAHSWTRSRMTFRTRTGARKNGILTSVT